MTKRILITLFTFVAFLVPTMAQDGARVEKERMYAESLKFRSAGWETLEEALYFKTFKPSKVKGEKEEDQYKLLDISEMQQSVVCQTEPGKMVTFYRRKLVGDAFAYSAAARVRVDGVTGKYLFLFFPPAPGGDGKNYRVYAVADEAKDSPFGAYQFHNLTGMVITGMLGKKKFQLSAKERTKTMKYSYTSKQALPFGLHAEIDGKRKWLARNTYQFNPQKHLKVFVYKTNDVNGRVKTKVKGLVDFYEPDVKTMVDGARGGAPVDVSAVARDR